MLRMGFTDDVEWDLIPETHQTALFSATMPESIRRVAEIPGRAGKSRSSRPPPPWRPSARVLAGQRPAKLDALTRILEVEEDSTPPSSSCAPKTATVELADKLAARGYAAAALNGDLNQRCAERVIDQLKRAGWTSSSPPTSRRAESTSPH